MEKFLAFDIGGTFIKYAVIKEDAELVESGKTATPDTLEGLINIIVGYAEANADAKGIAISAPGAVSEEGIVYGSSALPYIHGPNIKQMVKEKTNRPVFMENDANCAGYAEVWKGAARGKQDVLAVVLGTGIGGAVIKNGSLHKGAHLHGGEFGYMLTRPELSEEDNTWSATASTAALVRMVAAAKRVESSSLSGEKIFSMAETGDNDCINAIDKFYHNLAVGLYNLQYIFDPELIVIGGGISARPDLTDRIGEKLEQILSRIDIATVKPKIAACHFRQNSNLLGAVYGLMKQINPSYR
ncbi:ROK family protein [Sediminibacillus dalangtanensis]|uniref:ROK family protein n=1 Tax=Sediminibacillus dalangtanensis TaxID=2729421 RepID=A0ABX7VXU7_9BACI|nr:ROK family protein [Sediminibacillus dalangtanensis]QTM99147.1 ROK family protein [Sediminibacillus dalangtanensis]